VDDLTPAPLEQDEVALILGRQLLQINGLRKRVRQLLEVIAALQAAEPEPEQEPEEPAAEG
jgi:hypothetical protein